MSFSRDRFTRLLFGVTPAGDIFQQKINEIFQDLPNFFGIADDILIVAYDTESGDHKRTLRKVMQTCHCKNMKLNKSSCHFRYTTIMFFGEVNGNATRPKEAACA